MDPIRQEDIAAIVESLSRLDSLEKLALIDQYFDIEEIPQEEIDEAEEACDAAAIQLIGA